MENPVLSSLDLRSNIMARSKRYRQLISQLKILRKHLLPKKFSLTGSYSQSTYTKCFAFRVLCHAEIEAYFEERAQEIATKAENDFRVRKRVSHTALAILAFSGCDMPRPPETADRTKSSADRLFTLNKFMIAYNDFVKNVIPSNHGIKESNILELLLPIGIDVNDLDPLWFTKMNDFGTARGLVAHSSRMGIVTLPNPADELSIVNSIVTDILKVDELINKLMSP